MSRGKKMEVSIGLGHQKFLVAASFLSFLAEESIFKNPTHDALMLIDSTGARCSSNRLSYTVHVVIKGS